MTPRGLVGDASSRPSGAPYGVPYQAKLPLYRGSLFNPP